MIRYLYVRIYLTTLAALTLMVLLCALLWQFAAEPAAQAEHERFLAAMLNRALPPSSPAAMQASVDALAVPPITGVAVFDAQGNRLAGAGTLANLDHPPASTSTIHLDDGRLALMRMHAGTLGFHLGGLALIALIAIAVALGTYPVTRRLTRRLETLAGHVDRFGSGDLSVRANDAGKDELSRLASSFNQMAGRVTTLLGAHSRMLVNASHELRSPLARVRLGLELLERNPDRKLFEEMRRDCAEIDEQIEEIMLASKLETVHTAPPQEIVDLAVLLAEESTRLGVACEVAPSPVRGDARLLRRLIRNLLDNALKYGIHGVHAEVCIDASGTRMLRVEDRGPGIAEAERERIFEPFYRPTHAAENGSGWGLGLALVRQIAEHHGGSIRCLPREGGGCRFELRLPMPSA